MTNIKREKLIKMINDKECKCGSCGKVVDWIAEVNISPQKTNPKLTDFEIMVCLDCLKSLHKNKEVQKRMVARNVV